MQNKELMDPVLGVIFFQIKGHLVSLANLWEKRKHLRVPVSLPVSCSKHLPPTLSESTTETSNLKCKKKLSVLTFTSTQKAHGKCTPAGTVNIPVYLPYLFIPV